MLVAFANRWSLVAKQLGSPTTLKSPDISIVQSFPKVPDWFREKASVRPSGEIAPLTSPTVAGGGNVRRFFWPLSTEMRKRLVACSEGAISAVRSHLPSGVH